MNHFLNAIAACCVALYGVEQDSVVSTVCCNCSMNTAHHRDCAGWHILAAMCQGVMCCSQNGAMQSAVGMLHYVRPQGCTCMVVMFVGGFLAHGMHTALA